MQKLFKLLLVTILVLLFFVGCSSISKPQLHIINYPHQITQGEVINLKGEYLNPKPSDNKVKIMLTVKEIDSNKGLASVEKILSSNESQSFNLPEIRLSDLDQNIYFELKLIINGRFVAKVDTKSHPTQVANWHTNITTTYFGPAYDKNGNEQPAAFGNYLSKENPYYFALPYKPYYEGQVYQENTDVKNRWIEIYYPKKDRYVYAQWEDVGPWNVYDPYYVFGKNNERPYAENGIDMGWLGYHRETNQAGLDISQTVMEYLNGDGNIIVNWRFITKEQVPDGPWFKNISTAEVNPKQVNLNTKTLRNLN